MQEAFKWHVGGFYFVSVQSNFAIRSHVERSLKFKRKINAHSCLCWSLKKNVKMGTFTDRTSECYHSLMENTMTIRPLYDRILVKRSEEKQQMQGGLHIPDSA